MRNLQRTRNLHLPHPSSEFQEKEAIHIILKHFFYWHGKCCIASRRTIRPTHRQATMNTSTLIRFAAALLLAATVSNTQAASSLQDLVSANANFQYSAEQDVWVQIAAYDIEGAPADLRAVEILEALDADGNETRVLERGLTDATGSFERKVRVPAATRQLTVRVGVLGITNTVTMNLDGSGTLTHTFE